MFVFLHCIVVYFNVIMLLVPRVTKQISLYYNDNKVFIYHRGGGGGAQNSLCFPSFPSVLNSL